MLQGREGCCHVGIQSGCLEHFFFSFLGRGPYHTLSPNTSHPEVLGVRASTYERGGGGQGACHNSTSNSGKSVDITREENRYHVGIGCFPHLLPSAHLPRPETLQSSPFLLGVSRTLPPRIWGQYPVGLVHPTLKTYLGSTPFSPPSLLGPGH